MFELDSFDHSFIIDDDREKKKSDNNENGGRSNIFANVRV